MFSLAAFNTITKANETFTLESFHGNVSHNRFHQYILEMRNVFEASYVSRDFLLVFAIIDIVTKRGTYVVSIEKVPQANVMDVRIDGHKFSGDIYKWVSEKLGYKFNLQIWQSRILEVTQLTEVLAKITESEKLIWNNDIAFSLEDDSNKFSLEKEIQKFKSKVSLFKDERKAKDELEIELKATKEELDVLNQEIAKVKDFILVQERVMQEHAKFEEMSSAEDEQLGEKFTQIKTGRIKRIFDSLKTIKGTSLSLVEVDHSHVKKHYNPLLITSLFVIIYTFVIIGAFLYTQNNRVLIIGLVSLTVFLMLLMVFKIAHSNEKLNSFPVNWETPKLSYDSFIRRFPRNEDAYLVNLAWLRALRIEYQRITRIITNELEGKSIDEIKKGIEIVSRNIESIEADLHNLDKNQSITSDEYLEARRQIDKLEAELDKQKNNPRPTEKNLSDLPIILTNSSSLKSLEKRKLSHHFQIIELV